MLTLDPGFAIVLQLRVHFCARAHSSFGQFGGTYRYLFGQVPQMLGKCPMSDCNFILCKTTMKEEGRSDMIATISVLQLNGSMNKATQVMMTTQGS